jgi:hypothetical protein
VKALHPEPNFHIPATIPEQTGGKIPYNLINKQKGVLP